MRTTETKPACPWGRSSEHACYAAGLSGRHKVLLLQDMGFSKGKIHQCRGRKEKPRQNRRGGMTICQTGRLIDVIDAQEENVVQKSCCLIVENHIGFIISPFQYVVNTCNISNSSTIMLKCLQKCVSSKQISVVDSTIQKEPTLANSFGPSSCPD